MRLRNSLTQNFLECPGASIPFGNHVTTQHCGCAIFRFVAFTTEVISRKIKHASVHSSPMP